MNDNCLLYKVNYIEYYIVMNIVSSENFEPLESLVNIPTYKAGVAQSTAYRLLKKFTEDCVKPHGLTMMQWFIIGTIHDAGSHGIGVTELSKLVDTNVPYITNTLNLLEQKQIIIREVRGNDSRSKVVKIAPRFARKVDIIEADLRQKMRATIYADITPAELRTYVTVLYKLSSSLERFD
jgi:DNA-binding MarR family transcriptional regulator